LTSWAPVSRGKSKHRPRNDPKLFGGKYPFIQTADVKNADYYITKYSDTYNESGLAQSKLWDKGTLCITIAANIADTGVLAFPACFPDSIMGFVPFEGVANTRFIKYCFDRLQRDCKQISQGTAQDNLSWKKLSTIKFCIPEYKEQCRIADILSAYDDLIENNQKQIKLLEEAAQRLYKEWFVNLRFPGHENTKIVDGVPEGWRISSIYDVFDIKYGKNLPTSKITKVGQYPVYGASGVIGYYNEKNCDDYVTLVTSRGNGSGDVFRTHHKQSYVTNNSFIARRNDKNIFIKNEFTFQLFSNTDFKKLCTGSAQPQLTNTSIQKIKIFLPNRQLIEKYQRCTIEMSEKQEVLYKEQRALTQARNRLLSKLINGTVEV
jgi:type I restriction-modification system specificity subunit